MKTLRLDSRLELRALEPEHAEAWHAQLDANREFLHPWIRTPARIQSVEDAQAYMTRARNERLKGSGYFYGIWDSGALVGEVLLFGLQPDTRQGEVGYWLAEGMQGNGIVTRACRAVIDLAFRELALNRLEIRCGAENLRSQAIAQRLGFTREGTLRQAMCLNQRLIDQVVFGLLASEWPPSA